MGLHLRTIRSVSCHMGSHNTGERAFP